ncbi:MAG: hypothetical protein V4659_05025 [Pseudomonadota bacterium]
MKRGLALLALLLPLCAVHAAPLTVAKSSVVVADQVNTLNPKALPNATLDYAIRVDNPNGILSGNVVRVVVIEDTLPLSVKLRVADYGAAGSGPVEFMDGNLLGLGLLGSGLGYTFTSLASATDGLEFFDGTSWSYTPVADAEGFDTRVRAVRVRLSGTQAALSAFRLRFRVKLK